MHKHVGVGIDDTEASSAFRKMRRLKFARWSAYRPRGKTKPRNGKPVDTWQMEAPGGRHHVHWMLHIRPENRVEFEEKLLKWVRSMAGLKADGAVPLDAVHIADLHNPEGKKLYMAKGIDPFYAKAFKINHVDCGVVFGVRGGTARALGPSVWKPLKKAYLNKIRQQ